MSWTDDRVEHLKKLWAEGFSASQIATQLGGVTRNAVIGKAHRLKLASRTKSQPRMRKMPTAEKIEAKTAAPKVEEANVQASFFTEEPTRPTAATTSAPEGGRKTRRRVSGGAHVVGATALKMEFDEDAVAEQQPNIQPQENVVVAMSRKLSLMQLTEHTCKWPVGDPLSEDFYFCGADSGESGPYCACHAKLAFNSSSDRKKRSS